jgi:hypothetical protein
LLFPFSRQQSLLSLTKGNNSFFISTYEVEKYDGKLLFSLATFFAFSFKRLSREGHPLQYRNFEKLYNTGIQSLRQYYCWSSIIVGRQQSP